MPDKEDVPAGGGDARALVADAPEDEQGPPDNDDLEIHTPLDEDTYGAALFSIVLDCSEIFGGRNNDDRPLSMNIVRLTFVNSVLMANYALQFGMLYFIKRYVVDAGVKAAAAAEAKGGGAKETLIHMLLTDHPMFLAVVLILWTLTILIELRKVERFKRQVDALPRAATLARMFNKDTDDDGNVTWEIKGLTCGIKLVITVFIILPKIGIVICLFILGFSWLASTQSPADLILNALALAFVVNIDEQLYEALMPKCVKDSLAAVSLTTFKKIYPSEEEEQKAVVKSEWASYQRSIFYFIAPMVISAAFIIYMQQCLYADEAGVSLMEYLNPSAPSGGPGGPP